VVEDHRDGTVIEPKPNYLLILACTFGPISPSEAGFSLTLQTITFPTIQGET
jgi:hypothetical protein